jgi:hypothetical protein
LKKMLLAVAAAAALLGTLNSPAGAIVGGSYDFDRHPQTGLLLSGDIPICSGVLISPRVVATAGHCSGAVHLFGGPARVTFDPHPTAASTFYTGVPVTHPESVLPDELIDWDTYRNDYGAIVLDKEVEGIEPARLPKEGSVDEIRHKSMRPTITGYGVRGFDGNGAPVGGADERDSVRVPFAGRDQNSDAYLRLGNERKTACNGDSGGPAQIADTVVAITTGGLSFTCQSWAYFARMDIPTALDFYEPIVDDPDAALINLPTPAPAQPAPVPAPEVDVEAKQGASQMWLVGSDS